MEQLLAHLRAQRPLIHCISNLVTAGDCANILLAAGASPIMAQEPAEMEEIAAASRAVVLNTGTPSDEKFAACAAAGTTANRLHRPVVLDPVGAGASAWRREKLSALLRKVRPTLIRANSSEVAALLTQQGGEHGVDSPASLSLEERGKLAASLARRLGCVVLLSGETDLVTDGNRISAIQGGSAYMERITGAGCMLSCLLGAFAALTPDSFSGAVAAAAFWKSCAAGAQADSRGPGSFRAALFDQAALLNACHPEVMVSSLGR